MTTEQNLTVPASKTDMQTMGMEPRNFSELWNFSQALAKSALVPQALRGKPHDIMLVCLKGHELGVSMLSAISSIHVIDGKPCLSSDMLQGLVMRSGKCRRFRLVESTNTAATYEGERSDNGDTCRIEWTLDDAKAAGLLSKSNWRSYPKAMLRARASADLCRELWPDVCAGLYDLDEADDIRRSAGPAAAEVIDDGAPKRPATLADVKARLAPATQPVKPPEPPPQDDEVVDFWLVEDPTQPEVPAEPKPEQTPAPTEPTNPHPDPMLDPSAWYDPAKGGIDADDPSNITLVMGARPPSGWITWCDQPVWTIGPLKRWTPREVIMGAEGGGRHTLLKKAIEYVVSKKKDKPLPPLAAIYADYCLGLMEYRYRLMREANVETHLEGDGKDQ